MERRKFITTTGTRRARYRGVAKTHLEQVFFAVALNLIRLGSYWAERPLER
jgi:IS5 family transposase